MSIDRKKRKERKDTTYRGGSRIDITPLVFPFLDKLLTTRAEVIMVRNTFA